MSAKLTNRISKKHPPKDGEFLVSVGTGSVRGANIKDDDISKVTSKCIVKLMRRLTTLRYAGAGAVGATGSCLGDLVIHTTCTATGKGKSARIIVIVTITATLELGFDL